MYDTHVFLYSLLSYLPSSHWQDGPLYEPGPVQGFFLLKGRFSLPVLLALVELDMFSSDTIETGHVWELMVLIPYK